MLEDVKRVAESAQRMRLKLFRHPHFRLPFPLKNLRNAAGKRRTKLLFLSSGMSKRENNRTYYNQRIHENTTLLSVIENHLQPGPWNHQLRQFCDEPLESLNFFIRKYPKGPNSPFRQLDIKTSLKEQLANIVILEYPVIHVFLPSHSYNFEVVKNDFHLKMEVKDSTCNNLPSPMGVTFREEEIEDSTSSDPQILDLAKHEEFELNNGTDNRSLHRAASQGTKLVLKDDVPVHKSQDNMQSSFKTEVPEAGEEAMNFDFEQGLLGAYYKLIGQGNPNDFLNLEGVFVEGREVEERIGDPILSGAILEEDLGRGDTWVLSNESSVRFQ